LYDTVNRGTNSPSAWVYTNTVLGADVPPGITNVTLDLSAFPQTNWWYVFYATNAAGPAWGGAPILFKADTVGDGIPDWWRSRYFGAGATTNDASCATADPDKDGRDNLQEWISMTIPTNQASVLRFSGVLTPGPTIGLRFDSTTAREYSILGRTNLTWGSWFPVTNGVRGTDGLMTIELDVSSGTNSMFYRLDASIP
jgi:hypothetical protein